MEIHISFVAEKIFEIGNISITNSVLTALLATFLIVVTILLIRLKLNATNPGTLEIIAETVYEGLNGMVESIMGEDRAKKFFGFVFTFFIFVLVSNWLGLMPFIPAIGKIEHEETQEALPIIASSEPVISIETEHEDKSDLNTICLLKGKCLLTKDGIVKNEHFTPIFRAPTADLSSTITLALISVIVTNLVGLYYGGRHYIQKYIDFRGPINFFVGLLELISEIGKIISFAFRLFGNVFAGEVLLTVLTAITAGIATLPFLGLELFVGFIQAFVFLMLTTVFLALAMETH